MDPDVSNPLVPTTYDIVWFVAIAVAVVFAIAALVSIGRARLTTNQTLMWCVIALLIPILGLAAWFFAGRKGRDVSAPSPVGAP